MAQWVYTFGDGSAEGNVNMKSILGGKGANLAEMCNLGLSVPPGFTISTELCKSYYENGQQYPKDFSKEVSVAIERIESLSLAKFGDPKKPLLVSVRSGAQASMPGMMDTVLNLGLNDETVVGLSNASNNDRFAWDSYRRFIQMYADVVLSVDHSKFEQILDQLKDENDIISDSDLGAKNLKSLVSYYKDLVLKETGSNFPQNPIDQLWGAIGAVLRSWMNQRAITYRKINNIPSSWGTAVNVQAMVFGNMGNTSATGVAFTRNPSNGEKSFFGEFLINAQGEDVVAGIRTPQHLTKKARTEDHSDDLSLEELMPKVFKELEDVYQKLELHYRDMQDIEFTVQQGKLWMLQTRSGKRSARAAIKIAVDMVSEGLIDQKEAVLRVSPSSIDQLLHPMLDPNAPKDVIASGLPASPGAASGSIVFSPDEAERQKALGEKVILVREETSPEDIHGMHAAEGILTSRGGMTSHAAVVARGMGTPCVSGVSVMRIDYLSRKLSVGNRILNEGEKITIDGSKGEVIVGSVSMIQPELSKEFLHLMNWADQYRKLRVRTNAETPLDAKTARNFGAEGIGLCRTEHMFFDNDRIINMREMILSNDKEGRKLALDKLLPFQRQDFVELFKIMKGLPVTVRLLDPPLHEFLPNTDAEINEVAKVSGVDSVTIKRRASTLREVNPMLGHRGCRLGISFPEIYEMQVQAIFEAAVKVSKEINDKIIVEIMIPLVATGKEVEILREKIELIAKKVLTSEIKNVEYLIGTMIELPRAVLCSNEIAKNAQFFSFGTNDLTQTTYGISRDDSSNFLDDYISQEVFSIDPFVSVDQDGVGKLVSMGVELGRSERKDLKIGICGEHGGDPSSIYFFHKAGLDYVSASPYRVPIARLAAAQAVLANSESE